jgi:hypothetical protein
MPKLFGILHKPQFRFTGVVLMSSLIPAFAKFFCLQKKSRNRPVRSVRLGVEGLEDRITPSTYIDGSGAQHFVMDQANEHVMSFSQLTSNSSTIVVRIKDNSNNLLEYYTTNNANLVGDGSFQGGDTFNVNYVPQGVSLRIEEGSNSPDLVNAASFDYINGSLRVDGTSTTLTIWDQTSLNFGQSYTMFGDHVMRTGSAGTHTINFGNIAAVNLNGAYYDAGSSDTYSVADTPGWGATTSITTGLGTDIVNVLGTTGQLNVHGVGYVTANVGFWGSVQGINGAVNFDNPPKFTTINVDDHNDRTGQTFNIGGAWGWGQISLPTHATINYKFADTSSVTLRTGTGGNTVNVWATGTTTNVIGNGSQYLDHINVGYQGKLQYINGTLNISNPSGYWVINIDDSNDPNAQNATLGQSSFSPAWGTLHRLANADINYDYYDTYGLFIETNHNSSVWVGTDGGVDTWINGIFV